MLFVELQRRVRRRDGDVRTHLLLQHPTTKHEDRLAYAIEDVLTRHPNTGVTLLLAIPVVVPNDTSATCWVRCDGAPVVIKAAPKPNKSVTCGDNPLHEIAAMQHLSRQQDHPHIIRLLDCFQDHGFVYAVLPYLSGGDLFAKLEQVEGNKGLTEADAATYMRQMTEGLLFMKQTAGLAHHDVSLENVVLTSKQQGIAQIIDLGMCLRVPVLNEKSKDGQVMLFPQSCCGKASYMAPEVVQEEPFDPFAADVWSLGVCLYTMLTGRPLYNSPDDAAFSVMAEGRVKEVVDTYETYGLTLSSCAKELVCSMLHADPRKRPTLESVLQHRFLLSQTKRVLIDDFQETLTLEPNGARVYSV